MNKQIDWTKVFKILFWVQAGVNLVGALGPELSFDALWYHLPIARLIAERGWVGVIPGGLLYYSGMPRLMELTNAGLLWMAQVLSPAVAGLHLGLVGLPETLPKLVSWSFGLGCAGMIYKIARRYTNEVASWGAVLVWYSSLVVGWQSIVVYVDLARTLLVLISVWYWLRAVGERHNTQGSELPKSSEPRLSWSISALVMGLAYSVKIISGLDAVALGLAGAYLVRDWKWAVRYGAVFAPFPLLWGATNMVQGYDFFYPLFAFNLAAEHWRWGWYEILGPIAEILDPRTRVGPLVLVLMLIGWKKIWQDTKMRELGWVTMALLASWYVFPRTGMGRYFLPSLAILAVASVIPLLRNPMVPWKHSLAIGLIVTHALFGIGYRAAANAKFVPVILGFESKDAFLMRHLNFEYGDWYDADGWVSQNLGDKKYLVRGVHNTYYLPGRDWEHESWTDPSECFPYVLIQGDYPASADWDLIHQVGETKTRIYETSCL